MATLTPTIGLVSNDYLSDPLNISVTDTLSVTNPVELSTISCPTGGYTIIPAAFATATYVYLKNTDASNYIIIKRDAGSDEIWGRIHPGEIAFFCVAPSTGLIVAANSADATLEFGKWTKS